MNKNLPYNPDHAEGFKKLINSVPKLVLFRALQMACFNIPDASFPTHKEPERYIKEAFESIKNQ